MIPNGLQAQTRNPDEAFEDWHTCKSKNAGAGVVASDRALSELKEMLVANCGVFIMAAVLESLDLCLTTQSLAS